jgi:hypothetical protein
MTRAPSFTSLEQLIFDLGLRRRRPAVQQIATI